MTFTLYTLTSIFIFSILLSVHLLWCWQGEFVKQSRVPLVADHFLYSHDINVRFIGDIVRNNIALRLFSDTSQMTSKCSKKKKLENEAQASGSLMFSRLHITYQPWVKKKKVHVRWISRQHLSLFDVCRSLTYRPNHPPIAQFHLTVVHETKLRTWFSFPGLPTMYIRRLEKRSKMTTYWIAWTWILVPLRLYHRWVT